MSIHNTDSVVQLHANLAKTVALFHTFAQAELPVLPDFIQHQACMRRISLSFIALFEYLREASSLPQEYLDKQPEELAAYFVEKGFLEDGDKESFATLASMYMAIRWSSQGKVPDAQKIMTKVQPIFQFLKKVVDAGSLRHTM
jgi:aminoglycoside phosphotransferase family enzyme